MDLAVWIKSCLIWYDLNTLLVQHMAVVSLLNKETVIPVIAVILISCCFWPLKSAKCRFREWNWWCVGYSIHFPFIKHEAFRGLSMEEVNLYKYMFAPDLQPRTLAIIGCIVGIGPCAPMAEMQCRVATMVFKVCESILPGLVPIGILPKTSITNYLWRSN